MVSVYEIMNQFRVTWVIAQQRQRPVAFRLLTQQFCQSLTVEIKAQVRQQHQYHPLLTLPHSRSTSQRYQSLINLIRQSETYAFRSIEVAGNGCRRHACHFRKFSDGDFHPAPPFVSETFYFPFQSLHTAKFQDYFRFDDYKCRFSFCQYDGISINFSNSFIIVSCFCEIVLDFPTYLQKNVFLCLSHCQLGYLCNIFVDFTGKAKSIDKLCAFCNTRFSQRIIGTHLIRLEETF